MKVKTGNHAEQKEQREAAAQKGYLKRVLVFRATGRGVVLQGGAVQNTHGGRTYHGRARPAAAATFRNICSKAMDITDNYRQEDLSLLPCILLFTLIISLSELLSTARHSLPGISHLLLPHHSP